MRGFSVGVATAVDFESAACASGAAASEDVVDGAAPAAFIIRVAASVAERTFFAGRIAEFRTTELGELSRDPHDLGFGLVRAQRPGAAAPGARLRVRRRSWAPARGAWSHHFLNAA